MWPSAAQPLPRRPSGPAAGLDPSAPHEAPSAAPQTERVCREACLAHGRGRGRNWGQHASPAWTLRPQPFTPPTSISGTRPHLRPQEERLTPSRNKALPLPVRATVPPPASRPALQDPEPRGGGCPSADPGLTLNSRITTPLPPSPWGSTGTPKPPRPRAPSNLSPAPATPGSPRPSRGSSVLPPLSPSPSALIVCSSWGGSIFPHWTRPLLTPSATHSMSSRGHQRAPVSTRVRTHRSHVPLGKSPSPPAPAGPCAIRPVPAWLSPPPRPRPLSLRSNAGLLAVPTGRAASSLGAVAAAPSAWTPFSRTSCLVTSIGSLLECHLPTVASAEPSD